MVPGGLRSPGGIGRVRSHYPLVNRQTHVKTLPSTTSFAGDNKPLVAFCELDIDIWCGISWLSEP